MAKSKKSQPSQAARLLANAKAKAAGNNSFTQSMGKTTMAKQSRKPTRIG